VHSPHLRGQYRFNRDWQFRNHNNLNNILVSGLRVALGAVFITVFGVVISTVLKALEEACEQ
jgi:hypothetical protein